MSLPQIPFWFSLLEPCNFLQYSADLCNPYIVVRVKVCSGWCLHTLYIVPEFMFHKHTVQIMFFFFGGGWYCPIVYFSIRC
jgi:hypothetical protein